MDSYRFPVSQPREIIAVCDPSMPLDPADEILHENLSLVQGGARFEKIEKRIRMAAGARFIRHLVTGHAGSGKSTELLRLAARLRQVKSAQAFHVVYLDAFEYVSMWGVRLPHIIVALLAALAEAKRDDLKETRSGKKLAERLEDLVRNVSSGVITGIDNLTKLPILTTALKTRQDFSARFRDQATTQLQELLKLVHDLVSEVSNELGEEVVFIIDNLEKIPEQTVDGGSLHEALFVRDLPLLDLPAHLVITHPISLNYSSAELPRAFPMADKTTLPMVAVRAPPDRADRGDDRAGIEALRKLLLRRVARQVFDGDDTIDHLIRLSGGCVRDLMRFVGALPIDGEPPPYTRDHVDRAVQDFRNDYEKILLGKPYVQHLPAIASTGVISHDLAPEWKREILLGLVVLEYDSYTWFDVHPLAKLTRAFVAAARNGNG